MEASVERSGKLTAGAALAIVSGAFGVLVSIIIMAVVGGAFFVAYGLFMLILSALAIYGGYLALQKQKYTMAMGFGGICGLLVGGILGIVALVLIIQSKDEFTS